MSIFDKIKNVESTPPTLFNTGTLYDLMTGSYSMGEDGKFYLNGGLGNFITGIHGGGNMYKSTTIDSFILGALRTYKDSELFIIDTEGSKSMKRICNFRKELLSLESSENSEEIMSRIIQIPMDKTDTAQTFELLKDIISAKVANKKEMTMTVPFLNPKTGKNYEAWVPTFIFVDSLTEMEAGVEDTMLERGLEHKGNNTIWMVDGNKKTLLIRKMRKMASEYGIVIICSAHTGGNIAMDSFAPPTKQLQHMKQADRIKGVGSRFEFLTHVLSQVTSCNVRPMLDAAKKPLYMKGSISDKDLNEIVLTIQRNKTNSSGISCPFVISQEDGLLNCVSYLHYLKSVCKYEGLIGGPSSSKRSVMLYPDVKFSRSTIRKQLDSDYKLARALELMAKFMFIKNNWNLEGLPPGFTLSPEELYNQLQSSKMNIDEILETTGNWNYRKTDREYLSIMDIVSRLEIS